MEQLKGSRRLTSIAAAKFDRRPVVPPGDKQQQG
jgi:hypothetical protein